MFDYEEAAMNEVYDASRILNGEIYIPISIIEMVNEGFATMIIQESLQTRDDVTIPWAGGALSVMNTYKIITDGLLKHYAADLVPDTVPDDL